MTAVVAGQVLPICHWIVPKQSAEASVRAGEDEPCTSRHEDWQNHAANGTDGTARL